MNEGKNRNNSSLPSWMNVREMDRLLKNNRDVVNVENRRFLTVCLIGIITILCGLIVAAFAFGWQHLIPTYLTYLVAMAALALVTYFITTKKPDMSVLPLMYIFMTVLYMFAYAIAFFVVPRGTIILFVIVLFITPIVILDNHKRTSSLMTLMTIVFLYLAVTRLPDGAHISDYVVNGIVVAGGGLLVGIYIYGIRIHGMENQRLLKEQLELKKEMEKTKGILDSIHCGVAVLNVYKTGKVIVEYANKESQMQVNASRPKGTDAWEYVHPDDIQRVKKAFLDNYNKKRYKIENYRLLRARGASVHVTVDLEYKDDGDGYKVFYATYQDISREISMHNKITEQLQREMALRREADQANQMKTDFLSSVSHDMRTPLNAILGYTKLALQSDDIYEDYGYLTKINMAGETLLNLINDTLDLQRIENGTTTIKPEPTNGEFMIEKVITAVKPLMDQKKINFNVDYVKEDAVPIITDPMRFQEIFINLLSNAAKFTPNGGQVDLIIKVIEKNDDKLKVRFIVRDNGIGMSDKFIPKMFEPFSQERTEETAHIGGSGLGLSIVKRLVGMMGGSIKVKSKLGAGTEFTIVLEFRKNKHAQIESQSHNVDPGILAGMKVLLCEDNDMNMEIAKAILSEAGIYTIGANNGKEGVTTFKESEVGEFDAILMDLRMPVMNGYEAATEIRKMDRQDALSVPIIAMSADAYESDIRKCMDVGMNGHVSKPVNSELLFETLAENIIKSKPMERRS